MSSMSRPSTSHRARGSDVNVDELYSLARKKSKTGRAELFGTVGDLFCETGSALTERERALMSDILRRLIQDVEASVRRALAERLAKHPDAPYDLLTLLANDDIDVAHPILVGSDVLRDDDLIEIIRHRTQAHQLAIAARTALSEEVSEALVETGNRDVIVALLNNSDARLSTSVMEYLVEQSRQVDRFQEPLVRRGDLPEALAQRMYWWVSAALRHHIARNHNIDGNLIDDVIEKTALEGHALRAGGEDSSPAERIAQQMKDAGSLSETFLLQMLRQGEVALFEAAFAALVGVRTSLVRRILYERGVESLATACRAAGFRERTFSAIYRSSQQAAHRGQEATSDETAAALELYRGIQPTLARNIVRRWQREPIYQDALSRLETSG
jgi:uncharacterized protein (DUF2336 family)